MEKQHNFALALKELRKSKDITLEQISDSTNIKIKYLQKIESGDFTFKSDVYIKLFLKEYLKYIDFEKSDKILQEFNNLFSSSPEIDLTFMPMNEDEDIDLNENTFDINEYDPKKIATIILIVIMIIAVYRFFIHTSKLITILYKFI